MNNASEHKRNMIRVYTMYILLALFSTGIVLKTGQIMFVQGDEWREKAKNLTLKYHTIDAARGNIYDHKSRLLATSVPIYEVRFDPNAEALTDAVFNENIDSLALRLSNLFQDKTPFQYKRKLVNARNNGERYHLIKRHVQYKQLKALRQFPLFRKGRYKGGFIYIQQNRRQKPFRVLAARTIGYDRESESVGLEGAYSTILSGTGGKRLMKKIAGGVWMPVNDANEIEPEDGADLVTTIDVNIQDVAESALLKQLQKHDANHGCVVLMEVNTGEIRAIANLTRGSDQNYYESYNYAVGAGSEPGSTMKLASYMAAMEDGFIDPESEIETGNGKHLFYKTPMYDSKEGGYGTITVKKAFSVSSNIAIAKIIDKYYRSEPQRFVDRLKDFHLNEPTGVEIPGEGMPYIKDADDESWSGITLPWMSHGYELKLTPLQILTFYNAVANNGAMVKPRFTSSVTKHGKTVKRFEPVILKKQIASKETISKAREMLEEVVKNGTAVNLSAADYQIAGKTGTAQIAKGASGYDKVLYQASFCGYFPADDPKYSAIVVVNAPSRNVYYGNLVAGPIFKEIADKVYSTSVNFHNEFKPMLTEGKVNIPVSKNGDFQTLSTVFDKIGVHYSAQNKSAEWIYTRTGTDTVQVFEKEIIDNLVPNVRGMALQDAVYLLENMGLRVSAEGKGIVKFQSLSPGTGIQKGTEIKLRLT